MNKKMLFSFVFSFAFIMGLAAIILFVAVKDENKLAISKQCRTHTYASWVTDKNSTCEQEGIKHRNCKVCNFVQYSSIPKSGHTFSNWQTLTPATCTSVGSEKATCSVCGATSSREIAMLAHDYEETYTIDSEPSCTLAGSKSRHCKNCEVKGYIEAINPTGHNLGSAVIVTPATCTGEGLKTQTCLKCGEVQNTAIAKLGHIKMLTGHVDATCTVGAHDEYTCSRAGCGQIFVENEGQPLGHNYSNNDWVVTREPTCVATGLKSHNCLRCGKTESQTINKLGHNFEAKLTVDRNATCEEDGEQSRHCTRCDARTDVTVIKATGVHNFDEWVITKLVTCVEDGERERKCLICGVVKNEIIKADGHHSYDDNWTITKPVTCVEDGEREQACLICGAIKKEAITAVGHHTYNDDWLVTKTATCTTDGSKERKCLYCANIETQSISATGHSYGEWVVIPATCEVDGSRTRTCTKCLDVQTEITATKLGHDWGDFVINNQPTCTVAGDGSKHCKREGCTAQTQITQFPALGHRLSWKDAFPTCTDGDYEGNYCTRAGCDYCEDEAWVPATGHIAGDWEITREPTCVATGRKILKCKVCQYIMDEQIVPAFGHNHVVLVEIVQTATCELPEIRTYKCSDCDDTITRETRPALGHDWSKTRVTVSPTCTSTGIQVNVCSRCGRNGTSLILDALGHDWKETQRIDDNDGGLCVWFVTYKCSRCGQTKVETEGQHSMHYAADNSYWWCDVCGQTWYNQTMLNCDHSWVINAYGKIVCDKCGKYRENQDFNSASATSASVYALPVYETQTTISSKEKFGNNGTSAKKVA